MAYVFIVEFPAKPDRVAAFAELNARYAHNSRTLEEGCLAFDVCHDPDDAARFCSTKSTWTTWRTPGISRRTASDG